MKTERNEYQRKWLKERPGYNLKRVTEWLLKHPEKAKAIRRKASRVYRKNNALQLRARWQVYSAIKKGLMKRLPCQVCGIKAQAHHPDYLKPLDILWLCKRHHHDVHLGKLKLN